MMHCGYEFTMLDVQYRMHPEISSFPSRQFYNSQLRDGENVMVERGRRALLLNGRPYSFLQVNGTDTKGSTQSICNAMEANAVVHLVKELVHESKQYRSSFQPVASNHYVLYCSSIPHTENARKCQIQ